jgi:hypothetical protein
MLQKRINKKFEGKYCRKGPTNRNLVKSIDKGQQIKSSEENEKKFH